MLISTALQTELFVMEKLIPWYDWMYKITTQWSVFSRNKTWCRKEIYPSYCTKWYKVIWLSNKWVKKQYKLHRLIADSFIRNTMSKAEVNHINWIKDDNRICNLEWSTRLENEQHSRNVLGNNIRNKRSIVQCSKDWDVIKKFNMVIDAANYIWVTRHSIIKAAKGRSKTCKWYVRKYLE